MSARTRGRIASLVGICVIVGLPFSISAQTKSEKSVVAKPAQQLLSLSAPLTFEPNVGQANPKVKFLSRGAGYNFFYTGDEFVVQAAAAHTVADTLRLRLLGAKPSAPATALNQLPTRTNYFIGADRSKWVTGVKNYSRLRFAGVYSGIDLAFYGNQQRVQHDFVIAPNADPKTIAFAIEGARKIKVARDGDLLLRTSSGELRLKKPAIYQTIGSERRLISGGFVVKGNRVGFRVGRYDRRRELVIDPVIVYGTYLSGGTSSTGAAIVVNSSTGDAYVTGSTSGAEFPGSVTNGIIPSMSSPAGTLDVYIAKIAGAPSTPPDPNGSVLDWITFFGGKADDTANAIAMDSGATRIYVGGKTLSTDLATSPGAYQQNYVGPTGGGSAGLLLSLEANTGKVVYATYLSDLGADPDHNPDPSSASPTMVSIAGVAAFATKIAFAANTDSHLLSINDNLGSAGTTAPANPAGFIAVLDPTHDYTGAGTVPANHVFDYSTYYPNPASDDVLSGITANAQYVF